jgi:uncharacterized protein (TIGR04255 family)
MGGSVPLDLTQLDRSVLRRAPLASVICQVRYEVTSQASEARTARDFFGRLAAEGRFERLDQIVESSLNVSVGVGSAPAVAQQPSNSGWRLTSSDGSRVVILMPTHVSVEATSYEGWEADFAPLLSDTLDAISDLVSPVFEQRIGLRYINQVTEPEVEEGPGWRNWIDDSFLALATHDEIGQMVAFMRQQATLELDEQARCTVNSGFAPDADREGLLTFLLDFDISREGMRPFEVDGIRAATDLFNSYALRLFQLATTPELREALASA